jgi:heat shock protein HslJ
VFRVAIIAALILAGAVAAMGGCGSDDEGSSSTRQQPQELWGRKFVSISVTEGGDPRPPARGTRITLEFATSNDRRHVGWTAGCNGFGARVRATPKVIEISRIASTAVGCDADREQQDRWLGRFLESSPRWRLSDGQLTLRDQGTVIRLEDTET